MRILVISDIHANLAAFTAVLKRTREDRDLILCLGDIVGYGPDPNECVELAAEVSALILGGNHDLAAGGAITARDFSSHAKKSLTWTCSVLSAANKAYLSGLPPRLTYPKDAPEPILLSHGGPEDPIWSYILSEADAKIAFLGAEFSRCFFGHTHLPSVFIRRNSGDRFLPVTACYCKADMVVETGDRSDRFENRNDRFLLNPGSVGFPRNADEAHSWAGRSHAIARYALFDSESGLWQFKGVGYDMGDTIERMVQFGLW